MASAFENDAAYVASGERLEENIISVVSNYVKLAVFLLHGKLLLVGRKVDLGTGLAIIAFLGLLISGSVQLSPSSSLATHEHQGIQISISFLSFDSDGSSSPLSKPFEKCQNHQSVIGTLLSTVPVFSHTDESHICEIKPGAHHMKDKQPSCLQYQEKIDESNQLCDDIAGASKATFQDEVNSGVLQRSNHVKMYVSDVDSGDSSEHNNNLQVVSNVVNFLKNKFWSLEALLVFCFENIWLGVDIRFAFVVIMILGLGIPVTSGLWFDIPLLMYIIPYSFMLFSLILKCTPRKSLSHLLAGMAYTCAILSILGIFSVFFP